MFEQLWDDLFNPFFSTQHPVEFFFTCFCIEYIFCNRPWAFPLLITSGYLCAKKMSGNYGAAGVGVTLLCGLRYLWSHSIAGLVLVSIFKIETTPVAHSVLPIYKPKKEPLRDDSKLNSNDVIQEKTCLYLF